MTVLGFLIINKLKVIKSKFLQLCLEFYFCVSLLLELFSSLLGNKGVLPIHLSVWVPLLILFLICNIGMLR